MKILIVVDMQKDFVDGALGTKEACAIVPALIERIEGFDGLVLATRDTHGEEYLNTMEGKKLPVVHCVKGTSGWELYPEIEAALAQKWQGYKDEAIFDKPTFGSRDLGEYLLRLEKEGETIESITLTGVCTDICVISNALLIKAYLPETEVRVEADLCAGVTKESHERALEAMEVCQIEVIRK